MDQALSACNDRLHACLPGSICHWGLRRQTSTLKPFNPILGETYQGVYSSGVRVHAEQISHHPPVSSWQVADPDGKVCLTDICTPTNLTTNLLRSALNRFCHMPSVKP